MTDDSLFAYGDTAGFVNMPASRSRAIEEASSGKFSARAILVLNRLADYPEGLTWRELGSMMNLHHGQVSGVLSNLHRKGMVFMLHQQRDRCHLYVHANHRNRFTPLERIDDPTRTQASIKRDLEKRILAGLASLPAHLIDVRGDIQLSSAIAQYRRLHNG